MGSPFDVLGVDPEADAAAIRRAYRHRVLETHPDHGGTTQAFQRVQAAYEAIQSDGETVAVPTEFGAEATDPTRPPETGRRVEYLNYEVLLDNGWDLDEAAFEQAAGADLDPADFGAIAVGPDEPLLAAAERQGHAWPYACRGGACANCAVVVVSGDLEMPASHVLPEEMLEGGVRLSCVGSPSADPTRVVYNVKERPDLDDLRLPAHRFDLAGQAD